MKGVIMTDRPKLAYAVTENYENTGGIIFAKYAVVARREGASIWSDGDFGGVSCRRAKWADQCADTGIVPLWLMICHGWHFECMGCGRRIDEDLPSLWEGECRQDDPPREQVIARRRYRKWEVTDVIGTQHGACFCDQRCADEHEAHEAERKRRQDHAIAVFKAKVLERFPGIEFADNPAHLRPHAFATKSKGRWRVEQVSVDFTFPGMVHGPATYRWDARSYGRRRDQGAKPEKAHFGKNPQRMGPLTLEARAHALDVVLDVQTRARVDLINAEEEARIRELIAAKTFPNKWDGTEPRADVWLPYTIDGAGRVQTVMQLFGDQ